jgi:hypothetical protein
MLRKSLSLAAALIALETVEDIKEGSGLKLFSPAIELTEETINFIKAVLFVEQ